MNKKKIDFDKIWEECNDKNVPSPTLNIGTGSSYGEIEPNPEPVPLMERPDETVWLEYANDWLTVEKMAEYYNVDRDLLSAKIDRGRNV